MFSCHKAVEKSASLIWTKFLSICGKSTSPYVIFRHPAPRRTLYGVTPLPYCEPERRAHRLRPAEDTPIVLRCLDGKRVSGSLRCISMTGGLVAPASLIPPGSLVSLIFLTPKGPVVGTAQMLHPVSWKEQAFRFAAVLDSYKHRLQAMIQLSSYSTGISGGRR